MTRRHMNSPTQGFYMKVLIADNIANSAIEKIAAAGLDVEVNTGLNETELLKIIPNFDVIAVRSATKVNQNILSAAENLKLVVRAGVGLDNVDLQSAEQKGVIVKNTPNATSSTVAELVLGLMLSLTRHIPFADQKMKEGTWAKKECAGSELFGKTLGILGLGRIGCEVAKRAHAFGMNLIAHDPFIDTIPVDGTSLELVSFDALLSNSNIITLHLGFSDQTKNLLSTTQFEQMKTGSYLVNCARGGIVDEMAAYEALSSGKLAGAAFDVFAEEPLKDSPLKNLSNVILTPHIGASSKEGQDRAGDELADIIIEFSNN